MQMNDNAHVFAMTVIACIMTALFWRWSDGSLWSLAWMALAVPSRLI